MINQGLIDALFGFSSPPRTDFLVLDGEEKGISPEVIAAKFAAINPTDSSPNLYFYKISDKRITPSMKRYLEKSTFTTLGLDSICKSAIAKLVYSLPKTITKIGFSNLNADAADYLYKFLRTKVRREITIIYGSETSAEDKARFQALANELASPQPPTKKTKLYKSEFIVVLPGEDAEEINAAVQNQQQRPSDVIVELVTQNKILEGMLNRDPEGRYVLTLDKRAKAAETKCQELTQQLEKVNADLQRANDRIRELEEPWSSKKEPVADDEKFTHSLTLPPTDDYRPITELSYAHSLLAYESRASSPNLHGLYSNSIFSHPTKSVPSSQTSPQETQPQQFEEPRCGVLSFYN